MIPEFTCLCPLTGQPDFAHFTIEMVADELCVELKSLKLYFWSFRDVGAFHEKVTNSILDDIVAATKPRFVRITARWNVRGGISRTSSPSTARKAGGPPRRSRRRPRPPRCRMIWAKVPRPGLAPAGPALPSPYNPSTLQAAP